jgi:glycosyltransferase involved in cell wall biosynthesis
MADAQAASRAEQLMVKSEDRTALRVLNVVYDERFGGPQSRILQVARGLRSAGVETIVASRRGEASFAKMLDASAIGHVELGLVRARNSYNPIRQCVFAAGFWPNVLALRNLIRRYRPDVVHSNGALHLQGPIAAHLEGVALVWHLNDVYLPPGARRLMPAMVLRLSSAIAVASRAVADYYFHSQPHCDARIATLYPPVDSSRFNPEVDGEGIRSEFKIARDAPVVATAANLCPGKGIEHLLRAAAQIRRTRPQVRFLVAGAWLANRDRYRRKLLRLRGELGLNECVTFTGVRSDLERIFAAADIYVHPSDSEAAPMAVMEASASGLPVVATDVGGTREIVEDGSTGLLVAAASPEQISLKVLALLGATAQASEMGMRGAHRMGERFSLDVCVERHRRIYLSAVERTAAGARAQAA